MKHTLARWVRLSSDSIGLLVVFLAGLHAAVAVAQEQDLDNLAGEAAAVIFKSQRGSPLRSEAAVGDFAEKGGQVTALGVDLADEFSSALTKDARSFEVIDRSALTGIAPEYRTSPADLNVAKCYGIKPSAAVLVLGTIDELPDRVVLWIRVQRYKVTIFDRRITLPLTTERKALLAKPRPVPGRLLWVSPDHPPVASADIPTVGTKGYGYPACIYCPQAQYSDAATLAKLQGTVTVNVVISAGGFPVSIEVVKALPCGLSQQAIDAIKNWRLQPASGPDGKPVAVREQIEMTFHLY